MKTFNKYIATLLLTVAALTGFTACNNDDTHENENGVAVFLDNSQCSNVAVEKISLCIYDTGGELYAAYDYAKALDVASALLPLEPGHYSIAAVVNADVESTATHSLTNLRDWVATQAGIDTDLLSGIAEANVKATGITLVTIPLRQSAFSLPKLSVKFTLPDTGMAEYTPTRSRAAADKYTVRCVAELYKAGTDNLALHKVISPQLLDDGTYYAEFELTEGNYDLCLWADYINADEASSDIYYNTESLKAVKIVTDPYVGNIDTKDAAYQNESNIALSQNGTSIDMALQRPLAKYRIVANDVETYKKLMALEPDNYPPLEDLTVTMQYEAFFPSEFNAKNGTVTDAITGIGFSSKLTDTNINSKTLNIASDWIFTSTESSVTATIIVSDSKGNKVSSVSGVSIAYKQGYQTTITGKFLSAGVDVGGIDINTDWDEIIIEF